MKLCRINLSYQRPDAALVQAFEGLPAANIDDCLGRMSAVDAKIRPVNKASLLGTAFTIRVPAGDNLLFHYAMDMLQPGDIAVIAAGGFEERAIFGELMATYCQSRGAAGIVVDGCVRDYEELSQMTMPVYAKGVSPNGPYKNGPGTIGEPVSIGGQVICPGDILVGDGDGLVVIDPKIAEELLREVVAVNKKEEGIKKNILERGTYERTWVGEKMAEFL